MEIEEAISRTIKTAKVLGYFISGAVILFFFLAVAGELEGTWFDTSDNTEQLEETNGN